MKLNPFNPVFMSPSSSNQSLRLFQTPTLDLREKKLQYTELSLKKREDLLNS